jgi:hypothetical protein
MLPTAQPNGQGNVLAPTPGTTGGVGGPSASPPGGSPKNVRQRPRAGQAPAAPQTFANMQQQGMARPAPGMLMQGQNPALNAAVGNMQQQGAAATAAAPNLANGANAVTAAQQQVSNASAGRNLGMYETSQTAQQLGAPLMQQVMALLADPTQGLNDAAQSNFDRNNRVLGREFTELREGLNENMAARGLDASTIAATGLGQLGARQAEAQGDLAARIQEQLIRDRSSAMNNAINAAMGLRGQEIEIGRDEYTINRDTGQMGWDRGFKENRAAAEDMRFDKTFGLDEKRFGLDQDKFGWQRSTDERDFNRLTGRDAVSDNQWQQGFDRDGDWRADDVRFRDDRARVGDNQWQQGFDRDGQWRTEDNTYRDRRDGVRDSQFERGFEREGDWRADDVRFRDTRADRGDEQWQQSFDQGQRNFTTQTMAQILSGLGFNNLPPAMVEQIMRSLGLNPATAPTGGATPGTSWAGGGGTSGGVTNF